MVRATIVFSAALLLSLSLGGCGGDEADPLAVNTLNRRADNKLSSPHPVATRLERFLESDHREFLDAGAATFCEVELIGIGQEGSNPDVPHLPGIPQTHGSVRGTPIYTYHRCEDFRPKRGKLQTLSGQAFPLRFVVSGFDTKDFRVIDVRGPMDGAGNSESLRALFPDPYFDKVRDRGDGRFGFLGCAAVTEARRQFNMPRAIITGGSDACDPRS